MAAVYASGTQLSVINTEHFLSSPNVAGVYIFSVDTVNLVAGDVLELRCYKMVKTGGTTRVLYVVVFQDAQAVDEIVKSSDPVPNALTDTNALRFSLKQTAGSVRNFDWEVLSL